MPNDCLSSDHVRCIFEIAYQPELQSGINVLGFTRLPSPYCPLAESARITVTSTVDESQKLQFSPSSIASLHSAAVYRQESGRCRSFLPYLANFLLFMNTSYPFLFLFSLYLSFSTFLFHILLPDCSLY